MRVVRVAAHAEDALCFLGLTGVLRTPGTTLVDTTQGPPPDVTVVSVPQVAAATMQLLRNLARPVCGFVLISGDTWYADYSEAAELGVRAMLRRVEFTQERLLEAVELVAAGQACLPAVLQGGLLDYVGRVQRDVLAPRGLSASGLSKREADVLRMGAEGYSNAEISRKLLCSERTVKTVFSVLMKRLQLRNRTHVTAYAIRAGLI
ncbi:response regulator transcription factor [Streptomyces graminilatus]|uniref:response regulator transcription factor n=1 Tax=Streptomyces graminilatus TaxID=1464070 RepID=UPI000AB7A027|nr:response regulator transcription factor [Streptomyces graminilatus]